jgi:hypothetical protein
MLSTLSPEPWTTVICTNDGGTVAIFDTPDEAVDALELYRLGDPNHTYELQ